MEREKKRGIFILFLISFFFLGASLFINLPALQKYFLFADEAIYYSMTQSLIHDGDLEYTKKDLYRYYQEFPSGPLGIFLKKGKNEKIFFAKSYAYSLFTSPFVKLFGPNGFLVFHTILLFLVLVMGFTYFSLRNPPLTAIFTILTFLFASIAIVYFFWITPDFFNLFLVFTILFLWLYKNQVRQVENEPSEKENILLRFLHSDCSDYLASFLAGIAVFSKPPNIVLMIPLILYYLVKKKFLKTTIIIAVFLISTFAFWGANYIITGDWNYQGGERRTFYFTYPLEKSNLTFDNLGSRMTSEAYWSRHLLPPKVIFYNIFYYFWGRYAGITWYFPAAIVFLVLFFCAKKRIHQWLILSALASEILIYIILMPDNYAGGGGALANRYFLNIYPFFLFLPSIEKSPKGILFSWLAASLFISQILLSPLLHSHYPATHTKKFPFKLLPVELTLINNLPTNTNPNAFRQEVGKKPNIGWLHFLDDNFHPRLEPEGFWTRGNHAAEIILKTYYPVKELIFHLLNNPRFRNEITVEVENQKKKIILGRNQRGSLSFLPGKGFKMRAVHLYRIKIKASKGSIPYYEEEQGKERRFLGVFFEIEIIPEE